MGLNQIKTNLSSNSANSGILTSAGTGLAANVNRVSGRIQNLGTNPLFVKRGDSASTSDFTVVLAAGTGADDGKGGIHDLGQYTGIVTFAGTSPRCIASEETA